MATTTAPSALKHGIFSKMSFLPGEDPAEFEGLRESLVIEYQISGPSEEAIIDGIAKTFWQGRRKDLYLGFQFERARHGGTTAHASAAALGGGEKSGPLEPPMTDHPLENVASIATLDLLSKEVDLDMKLQAKLDRQFRMLFAIKASKQIDIAPHSAKLAQVEAPPLQQLPSPSEEKQV